MSDLSLHNREKSIFYLWRPSWRMLFGLLFLGVCSSWSYLAYSINDYAQRDDTRSADAAVVLGAGVWRGRPSPVFRERINHAIKLYRDGYVDTLIFTGGLGRGDELTEGAAARLYALENGIPAEAILIEETSTSTVENLRNAQQVAQANDLDTFLIVSTPYHMKRAINIATDLGMEAYSSPTRTIRWISRVTQTRALIQETISYVRYLLVGTDETM
ncbi:MAG: YdcF family protein [Anaerolineales bacterium]|nr:YdcF family protein [Anaerolineales bacterium]